MYAAQGYAVVATDYLGYAKSNYSFHPYLHADSEASSVIDSREYVHSFRPNLSYQTIHRLLWTKAARDRR